MARLLAVSDLHAGYPENRRQIDRIRPQSDDDWLLVAGDVADRFDDVVSVLVELRQRFVQVVWTPGNHELWTLPTDPMSARGQERYRLLVEALATLSVLTPEDPFPVWHDDRGPLVVAPLFLLPDDTLLPPGVRSAEQARRRAETAGVVCTDEALLHADPYVTTAQWAQTLIARAKQRLDAIEADAQTVLVSHYPLVSQPLRRLRHPEFALWCGSRHTWDWPRRYRAAATVYGHLHIPGTTVVDGIAHREVSLGYPHEWSTRQTAPPAVTAVLSDSHPRPRARVAR